MLKMIFCPTAEDLPDTFVTKSFCSVMWIEAAMGGGYVIMEQENATTTEEVIELESLGIEPRIKNDVNNNKEELKELADNIKTSMYQDYKLAYSEKGEKHREEAESTLTA